MSNPTSIAYLGPAGTFTEMAAKQLAGDSGAVLVAVGNVSEALDQVLVGTVDRAVVPIENSLEGGVSATGVVTCWQLQWRKSQISRLPT